MRLNGTQIRVFRQRLGQQISCPRKARHPEGEDVGLFVPALSLACGIALARLFGHLQDGGSLGGLGAAEQLADRLREPVAGVLRETQLNARHLGGVAKHLGEQGGLLHERELVESQLLPHLHKAGSVVALMGNLGALVQSSLDQVVQAGIGHPKCLAW
ncbi:hypothetical protein SSTU70S_05741 [Stutzerimonas stutzeri]